MDGTTFKYQRVYDAFKWTIQVENGTATLENAIVEATFSGPVVLDGNLVVKGNIAQGGVNTFSGVVSGNGGLTVHSSKLTLSNEANTFTGGVTVNPEANLILTVDGALPGASDLIAEMCSTVTATSANIAVKNVTLKDKVALTAASLTADTLSITGAVSVCDVLTVPSMTFDASSLVNGDFATTSGSEATDLSALTSVNILNASSLSRTEDATLISNAAGVVNLPTTVLVSLDGKETGRYKLTVKENALRLTPVRGMILIVK